MIYLAFFIPFITCLILYFKYRKETVWWEYLVVYIPSILAALLTEFCINRYNTADTEYLGSYAVSIRHYEEWNEWVHRTCACSVGTGKHRHTVSYDCSYCQEHPEEWVALLNNGSSRYISEHDYNVLVSRWNTRRIFIDMHRDYHTVDGDAQQYNWDGSWQTAYTYTDSQQYENRTQASNSLYKFREVTEEDKKFYGLFDYPDIGVEDKDRVLYMDQNPIMGASLPDSINQKFRFINGCYGKQKQFRIYVCLFPSQSADAGEMQRSAWKGGNKNELTVCIGTDSLAKKVNWVSSFSWCDNTSLEVSLKQYLLQQDTLDLSSFGDEIIRNLNQDKWERKEFKDFQYITIDVTPMQYLLFIIVIVLVNIALSWYVVTNEYKK